LIARRNDYIVNILFLLPVFFLTVVLYRQCFIASVPKALMLAVVALVFFVVTLRRFEWGILLFIFFIPLYHIFGVLLYVSRFLTVFSMFLGVLLGGIIYLARRNKSLIDLNLKITMPIIIFTILITISFLFVYLRIYDYLSLSKHYFRDYALNVDLATSAKGFSLASYQYLNYLCGFLFLFLATKVKITKNFIIKLFYTLFLTNTIVFLSILYQVFINPYFMGQATGIGNQSWIAANTFVNRYGATLVDPNSLGIYSIIILLVFVGFTHYLKVKSKIAVAAVGIIECLTLLMFSGSRTGLLGLILIVLFYIFLLINFLVKKVVNKSKINKNRDKKVITVSIASFLIIIIIFSFISIFAIKTLDDGLLPVTLKRVKIDVLSLASGNTKEAVSNFLGGRQLLWIAALHIIRDHPIEGAGIGMITIELPNYGWKYAIRELPRDMADNYYLQVMAELGIFALIVNLWIFWAMVGSFQNSMLEVRESKPRHLIVSIFLVLPVMLFMFVFGPHTYFMEIALLFYFFMGIVINLGNKSKKNCLAEGLQDDEKL